MIEVQQLKLNTNYNDTIALLGQPVKERVDGDLTILWYRSKDFTLADYVYFKSDKAVLISKSIVPDPSLVDSRTAPLQSYINKYGLPDISVKLIRTDRSETSPLPFKTQVIHLWNNTHKQIISMGWDALTSEVIREQESISLSQDEFFRTFYPDIDVTAQTVKITNIQTVTILQSPRLWLSQTKDTLIHQPVVLGGSIIGLVVVTILLGFLIPRIIRKLGRGKSEENV